MLRSANVQAYRQPAAQRLRVERSLFVLAIGEAQKVPARAGKPAHGVRFALGRAAALWAGGMDELGQVGQWRASVAPGQIVGYVGQQNRQICLGNRYRATMVAGDHGDRRAPVTLPADQPIVHAVLYCSLPVALALHHGGNAAPGLGRVFAVKGTRVGHHPLSLECTSLIPGDIRTRPDHLHHWQSVGLREFIVTLVVGWHSHDGAGAVAQ